jgi:hypothetical protein
MGPDKQQALLQALKSELKFCELGGYKEVRGRLPARAGGRDPMSRHDLGESKIAPHKEILIFRDSPLCLNYGIPAKERPCAQCVLIELVPAQKRAAALPCHHIPLNQRGDSVATLGRGSVTAEVNEAVVAWLRAMIQQLEDASLRSQSQEV